MEQLSDEMLVAYADGELSAEEWMTVQRLLGYDRAARDKVDGIVHVAKLLRTAFQGDGAQVAAVLPFRTRWRQVPAGRSIFAALAAVAAVVLTIGVGFESEFRRLDGRTRLMTGVAASHSVYAQETEHLAEVHADRKAHIEEWLGRHLKRRLSIPDLSSQGWGFDGARLLAEGGRPMAHLLYTAPGRQPIALSVTFSDLSESEPAHYEPGDGLHVAAWDNSGYLYIIVGALEGSEMASLTTRVRRHFST
jgi:anti-sigma factor RsiW